MGSCSCRRVVIPPDKKHLKKLIVQAIEQKQLRKIIDLMELAHKFGRNQYTQAVFEIDEAVTIIQGFEINALAYALRLGAFKIFKYLYEECSASLVAMEKCYQQVGKNAMAIIWENGHAELVKYYMPIYMANNAKVAHQSVDMSSSEQLSIFTDMRNRNTISHTREAMNIIPSTASPIMRAWEYGSLEIVAFIYSYFKGRQPPSEFDIHEIDDRSGENCALIAARCGNLELIKFLYEICRADFEILNKRDESATQIAIIAAKKRSTSQTLKIVRYLTEVVGVDLCYNYEETLLACENRDSAKYIEAWLSNHGISDVDKSRIDSDNSLTRHRPPRPRDHILEERMRGLGKQFDFCEVFHEELYDQQDSELKVSSIIQRYQDDNDLTPISIIDS